MLKQPRLAMQDLWVSYCGTHYSPAKPISEEEERAFWFGVKSVLLATDPGEDHYPASLKDVRTDLISFIKQHGRQHA